MGKPLRVLIVEDSEDDVLLIIRAIKKGGFDPDYKIVETAQAMREALFQESWDIILSDYKLPVFNGLEAIAIVKKAHVDIPQLLLSPGQSVKRRQ